MLMQNFGLTNKEHYGMLWYFLEWSITQIMTQFRFLRLHFGIELFPVVAKVARMDMERKLKVFMLCLQKSHQNNYHG